MKKIVMLVSMVILCSVVFTLNVSAADKLLYMATPWGTPSQELLDKFAAETGITVEVTSMEQTALRDKVLSAAAGKVNPADIIYTGIDDLGVFASAGITRPLDEMVSQELLDALYGSTFFTVEGKLYAVPIYSQMVMIDYDKAALEKIGVTEIATWDEFEKVSMTLKEQGISEYPISFGVRSWSWFLMALSSGSKLFDEDLKPVFDDPNDPGFQTFVKLIEYYNKGLISPERITSPNPHPAFWAGQAVFHQSWQGGLAIANDPEKSKVAPNADYWLLPEQHFTWSLPGGIGISIYTELPEAAMKFIEFMTTEEVQIATYETHGMFPARKATFEKLGAEGKIDGFEVMKEQANYLVALPYATPWFSEFNTEATKALVRAAQGEQTAEEAVKALAQFTRDLQEEYE
ncbi:extracellular solute-binding protein family 1 [Candidatus Vecturithrix granuli]|uniref:Extracellular solute-binding protein family 1 n=1 Tax=Vecturithrix granuli TaxID=1499967 RepID=A0A081BW39_VECG1|nr:extracellular solute-binding protein family 1 [Candidatus Vecturithrix granuli]